MVFNCANLIEFNFAYVKLLQANREKKKTKNHLKLPKPKNSNQQLATAENKNAKNSHNARKFNINKINV